MKRKIDAFVFPPNQKAEVKKHNKLYEQALKAVRENYITHIDEALNELEEQEKDAVGSKLTATLKGQTLLHRLKAKIILA